MYRYVMAHVSKKKLKEEAIKSIHKRFAVSLVGLKTEKQATQFMSELLTDTEKLMLGKRLAIICMLSEGVTTYRIEKSLGVSISTVVQMKSKFGDRQYDFIESIYKQKKKHKEFWQDIDKLLRLGMPPMGKGRWQWLHEMEARER